MNSYTNKVVIILHNSFGSHLCYWVCRDILLIGVTKSMNWANLSLYTEVKLYILIVLAKVIFIYLKAISFTVLFIFYFRSPFSVVK